MTIAGSSCKTAREGFPYLIEKGFDGIKVTPWDSFILESRSKGIAVRHLVVELTDKRWKVADEFLAEARRKAGSERVGVFQLISNVFISPRSSLTVASEMLQLHRRIGELEYKLRQTQLAGVRQGLMQQIAKTRGRLIWKRKDMDNITKNLPKYSHFPYSAYVASFWQELEVIPPRPFPREYFPSHFSDVRTKLPFAPGIGLQRMKHVRENVTDLFTGPPPVNFGQTEGVTL